MKGKIEFSFLTGNYHKFIEAKEALSIFPDIELNQINEEKMEFKDDGVDDPIFEIAKKAAEVAVKKYNAPVVVEDAGLFFNAYPGFPGMNTKWTIKRIGYDGILRLLDGLDRAAYFRSVIAYTSPNDIKEGNVFLFDGKIEGHISTEVIGHDVDCMDYDRIFIPLGETSTFSLIMDKKKTMSHRKIAFQKLGEFLVNKKS